MYCGWLEDAIWALAESDWEIFQKFPYCLLTVVDSSDRVDSMVRGLLEPSCSILGHGLLVRDARIVEVGRKYNFFDPFDELWLFERPPVIEKPTTFEIVGPLNLSTDALPEGLLDWFNAAGCVLGLGDGIGLNYITRDKAIHDSLMDRQNLPPSESYRIVSRPEQP